MDESQTGEQGAHVATGAASKRISTTCIPVLTGSGASAALGFPMMGEAVARLPQFLRALPSAGGYSSQNTSLPVLREYDRLLQEELRGMNEVVDLEALLLSLDSHISYLSRGAFWGLTSSILGDALERPLIQAHDTPHLVALHDLRFAYMQFIHQLYGRPLDDELRGRARASFAAVQDSLVKPLALFTTNYDTVGDAVPGFLGRARVDGFIQRVDEGAATWSSDGYDGFSDGWAQTPVYYLHGSASWMRVGNEIRRFPGLGRLSNIDDSLLIYPGNPAKDLGSGSMPQPLREAHDVLAQTTAAQGLLVAIGYSFRDPAVRRELERAATFARRSIAVLVISPNLDGSVRTLFEDERIQGTHIPGGFENPEQWAEPLAAHVRAVIDRSDQG